MSVPKISVVMSVYKEPLDWIQQSIDSVLRQTYTNFEFIIVDDNPKDEDLRIFLERHKTQDERITLIINETNIGLTKSLNKGIAIAQGEYIARMDADDISLPERFEKQICLMNTHPEIAVCGTAIECFGTKKGVCVYPTEHSEMCLFITSCFAHPSVMIRANILKEFLYDESFIVAQDYELWVRMYAAGTKFSNLKDVLLRYRVSKVQISSSRISLQKETARTIRRRALSDYLNSVGLENVNLDSITFDVVRKINLIVKLPIERMQKFNYLLFLLVDTSFVSLFKYLLFNKIPLGYKCSIKLLCHKLLNHQLQII